MNHLALFVDSQIAIGSMSNTMPKTRKVKSYARSGRTSAEPNAQTLLDSLEVIG